ncbi:hypothetical protein HNQ56_002964 [Anaerotaenia torta]|uniref:hypothetical protein n=1 Tax=Anaerotaenia torta TaxID=433293 RepID=UPI003D261CF8
MVKVELCEYNGWKDCVRISNDRIEVIAATQIGPRVLRFAFLGGNNIFYEKAGQQGLTGGDEWRIYGGHRLWHGPQIGFRPNEPDNERISYELLKDGVVLTGNRETLSGMRKQLTIRIPSDGAEVEVLHEIRNQTVWPVELTAWALSVMAGGGLAIWPNTKRDTGFLPNQALVTWPYTNLEDSRLNICKDYIALKQDSRVEDWFKAGTGNVEGWAAYLLEQTVFLKKYKHIMDANYSDMGSSFEIYTDLEIIELESLSPITKLKPGENLRHRESWRLLTAEELGLDIQVEGKVLEDSLYGTLMRLLSPASVQQ